MYIYADYNGGNLGPSSYEANNDQDGPQIFYPYHCYNYYLETPLISVIGDQSNITDSYLEYFVAQGYYYKWQPAHFANAQDFNDYISSPNYKKETFDYAPLDYPGVCIGLQHFTDKQENGDIDVLSNNYTFSLHFPDKAFS